MICREIYADALDDINRLVRRIERIKFEAPSKVILDETWAAWNDYASECKQIWNKYPPKETPCGTKMEFSNDYTIASSAALLKKNERIARLYNMEETQ